MITMKRHFMKRSTGLIIAPYLLLIAVLLSTNPQRLPAAWLLLPFVLLLWGLWATIYFSLRHLGMRRAGSARKRLVLAFCLALLPTLFLALQSINQLTARDVLLLGIFMLVLLLYVSRTSFNRR